MQSGSDDEGDLVDHAPAPLLARLGRAKDGVVDRVRVLRGVPVRRRVAAADLPARHAHAQVQPAAADREAILTTCDLLRELGDLDPVGVGAGDAHS